MDLSALSMESGPRLAIVVAFERVEMRVEVIDVEGGWYAALL